MAWMWIASRSVRSIGRAAVWGRWRGERVWGEGAKREDCRLEYGSGKGDRFEHGCGKGGGRGLHYFCSNNGICLN